MSPRVCVATYNVHQWTGSDGVYDPDRVIDVINRLNCEIIALQEAFFPNDGSGAFGPEYLTERTGLKTICAPTLFKTNGSFGNVLLTRFPVSEVRKVDLSYNGSEPRCAVTADLTAHGHRIRVIATHLGLGPRERGAQIDRILDLVDTAAAKVTVLLGDFNLWMRRSPGFQRIRETFGKSAFPASFPSRYPILALDRIWVYPAEVVESITAHSTVYSDVASDHIPVRAIIKLTD